MRAPAREILGIWVALARTRCSIGSLLRREPQPRLIQHNCAIGIDGRSEQRLQRVRDLHIVLRASLRAPFREKLLFDQLDKYLLGRRLCHARKIVEPLLRLAVLARERPKLQREFSFSNRLNKYAAPDMMRRSLPISQHEIGRELVRRVLLDSDDGIEGCRTWRARLRGWPLTEASQMTDRWSAPPKWVRSE